MTTEINVFNFTDLVNCVVIVFGLIIIWYGLNMMRPK